MDPFLMLAAQSKASRGLQIANLVSHGFKKMGSVYRNGALLIQNNPVEFHTIEDDKLIIEGAYSMIDAPDGVYLDCAPDWVYPEQNGNVLTIEQVYSATKNGFVLEVE